MDKKLIGLMMIFMLTFGLYTTITVFNKPLTRLTRAKEEFVASSDNSLIFAWPLSSKVEGKSSNIQVNVFVRNATNVPLPNKKVVLTSTIGSVSPSDVVTDKGGKATFTVISDTVGLAELSAMIDNTIQIKQKVTIKFE